jgi:hypothetical protein
LLYGIGGGVEIEQHILQDVFSLSRIAHLAAYEVAQPRPLTRNDFGEARGVGGHVQVSGQGRVGEGVHGV